MPRRKTPTTDAPDAVTDAVADTAPDPVIAVPEAMAVPLMPSDPAPTDLPPARPAQRRSGVLGPLLGGALAAIGGFALSHFNVFNLAASDQTEAFAALDARLAALASKVAAGADQAALATLQGDLAALSDRLTALENAPAPETADLFRLDDLDRRLAAIEALPAGTNVSTTALEARLAELERQLAAQPQGADQAKVDAALARLAEAEAEADRRAAARDRLVAAIATGAGFETQLAALDDPALTQALAPYVGGVATLAELKADFPDAARQVLDLARTGAKTDGWGARLMDFLADQTGARSLTPREGDDPDAILSRAEFELAEGRVADALTELQALDPVLRAPFDGWIARAEAQVAVTAVLEGR